MLKMSLRNGKTSMEYKIIISENCLEEIELICTYIEKNLKAEQASKNLRGEIIKNILRLKDPPKIFARINKTDRKGRNYRRIVINNFVLIYTIIEKDNTVLISHMYYSRRNYINGNFL